MKSIVRKIPNAWVLLVLRSLETQRTCSHEDLVALPTVGPATIAALYRTRLIKFSDASRRSFALTPSGRAALSASRPTKSQTNRRARLIVAADGAPDARPA